MSDDDAIRARIQEHWDASERGDIEAEHAIYTDDALLDYPQSGERFRGRAAIQASAAATRPTATSRSAGSAAAARSGSASASSPTTARRRTRSASWSLDPHEKSCTRPSHFADPFEPAPDRAALAEQIEPQ